MLCTIDLNSQPCNIALVFAEVLVMIRVTRLDGSDVYINENNIQWMENLPDTTITFLNGARLLVRERIVDIVEKMELKLKNDLRIEPQSNFNEMSGKL